MENLRDINTNWLMLNHLLKELIWRQRTYFQGCVWSWSRWAWVSGSDLQFSARAGLVVKASKWSHDSCCLLDGKVLAWKEIEIAYYYLVDKEIFSKVVRFYKFIFHSLQIKAVIKISVYLVWKPSYAYWLINWNLFISCQSSSFRSSKDANRALQNYIEERTNQQRRSRWH